MTKNRLPVLAAEPVHGFQVVDANHATKDATTAAALPKDQCVLFVPPAQVLQARDHGHWLIALAARICSLMPISALSVRQATSLIHLLPNLEPLLQQIARLASQALPDVYLG